MNELLEIYESLSHLHSASGISEIVAAGGIIALVAIIFAETGLLVGFFLPGDSLLITAGVLANPNNPNFVPGLEIWTLLWLLMAAAILGDQTGFYLGRKAGNAMWKRPDGRFYKRAHLKAAAEFYEKHGGIAVVGARYVPILRTFVPFVAGMARMPYRNFVFWNILGGVLWITSLLWAGYYLGQTSFANRLDKLIVIVVLISILPMIIGGLRKATARPSSNAS